MRALRLRIVYNFPIIVIVLGLWLGGCSKDPTEPQPDSVPLVNELSFEMVGQLWQGTPKFAFSDDKLVCMRSGGLDIFDVSSSEFHHESRLPLSLTGQWRDYTLILANPILYLLEGNLLQTFDLNDSMSPQLISVASTDHRIIGAALNDNHIYLSHGGSGVTVVDVADPAAPQPVYLEALSPHGLGTMVANNAFLASGFQYQESTYGPWYYGLSFFDISNPTNPELFSTRQADGFLGALALDGSLLYFCGSGGMEIFDLGPPAIIPPVGNYELGFSQSISLTEGFAYLAGSDGLRIVDVTDPTAPEGVSGYQIGEEKFREVATSGNKACTSNFTGDIHLLDIADPTQPVLEALLPALSLNNAIVESEGSYLYLLGHTSENEYRLWILDLENSQVPQLIGYLDGDGLANDLLVQDNNAFISETNGRIRVVDLSVPDQPATLSTYQGTSDGYPCHLALDGNFIYSSGSGSGSGIEVVDISNPANPAMVGFLACEGSTKSMTVVGGFAYLDQYPNGLLVVDLAQPESPTLLSTAPCGVGGRDIHYQDGFLYLVETAALVIVDVREPANPVVISRINLGNLCGHFEIWDDYALVEAGGLRAINIADPERPHHAGTFSIPIQYGEDFLVAQNLVYTAGGKVFSITPPGSSN